MLDFSQFLAAQSVDFMLTIMRFIGMVIFVFLFKEIAVRVHFSKRNSAASALKKLKSLQKTADI